MDNFFQNLAAYLLQDVVKGESRGAATAMFDLGPLISAQGWPPIGNTTVLRVLAHEIAANQPLA